MLAFHKAVRHIDQQEVGQDVTRGSSPAVDPRRAPKLANLFGLRDDLVLLVVGKEKARFEGVAAHHRRKIVFPAKEVLVVVPGGQVPQSGIALPAPERGVRALLAENLVGERKDRG